MKAKVKFWNTFKPLIYIEMWVDLDENNMPPKFVVRLMKAYDRFKIIELKANALHTSL